ncbi:DNA polymerase II large subunit [Candidatus Woesearchaeota archaeon]|nr:DNA polymerase II large subunit [Candidatus Woesearchaeota archaeon]MCF8013079.1 DNA polymerase II large subunit [Candidatus Woesearchaeota archaeon]
MALIASESMKKYFFGLKEESLRLHKFASEARKKSYDPEDFVEVKLAENLAERVVGLISAVAPQIEGSGAIERILELENEISPQDWRVAMKIALEIAQEKFCKFKNQIEAMEIGIRTGFAYVTLGVVSAPLEGFTSLELKDRLDGKGKYMCINYAGPIRAAGGTGAAVSVLIADYVRKHMGFLEYDATEKECQRCPAELEDYHEYVANLQYFPSKEESVFLMQKIPVEISGDPSEKREVSSALYKDIPRIPTNKLRSGYCLIHSSCIPLKAPKLWKNLSVWGNDMGMEQWNFLEKYIKEIQAKSKSKGKQKKSGDAAPIYPDYTYVKDLVGGRPVIGHPMRSGAFRLRYGRSRTSGFSGQSIHPATMHILNSFVATGTQLKVERPGKAAAYSSCDTIEGPIVKLKNGDVLQINSEAQAKHHKDDIKEIIYTGDVLINYGDFFDRAHKLIPSGYCQEYWIQEFEEAALNFFWTLDYEKLSELLDIDPEKIEKLIKNFTKTKISFEAAKQISERLNIPLHPQHTFFWKEIKKEKISELRDWISTSLKEGDEYLLENCDLKRELELLGIPHKLKNKNLILNFEYVDTLKFCLQTGKEINLVKLTNESKDSLDLINKICSIKIKDKSGIFIGSRMGRPEKAKMRKLTGSPHVLFPVGEEGGRLRSFQAALEKGYIKTELKMYRCKKCNMDSPFRRCHECDSRTEELERSDLSTRIKIQDIIHSMKKKLKTNIIPDLIKGVRGTSNKERVGEHIMKGILRAKHGVSVNKDGTVRYDCSEVAITHFKPKEIGTSIEKLNEMGYEKDIFGKKLEKDDQILELKIQDIVIPCSPASPDEPADEILFRTTKFIDEMLIKLYDLKPFYNLEKKEDLAGHLTIGLAPHTSAGIITRIVGFSKTQAFYAHPYIHAAMRRDCDGDESCITLALDAFLNFSQKYLPSSRGSVMDAPLVLTSIVLPSEVDDMIFNMDIAWKYPLAFYRASEEYKLPYDVKIPRIGTVIGTPNQYENIGFTHDTYDFNQGVLCSAYKLIPSMGEKVEAQMDLAIKLRAVDERDVAKLIINKHFIRDTKGNLRKFSLQQFRCVGCNAKFRRPPLSGKCTTCKGKVIFTISEGSIVKYIDYCLDLVNNYDLDLYTRQAVELTKRRIESVFGKEKEIQTGLSSFV